MEPTLNLSLANIVQTGITNDLYNKIIALDVIGPTCKYSENLPKNKTKKKFNE